MAGSDEIAFTLKADSLLTPGMIRLWAALRDKDFYSAAIHYAELVEAAVELVNADEAVIHDAYRLAATVQAHLRDEGTCRECGCTPDFACVDVAGGPCGWAAPDLCTSCADLLGLRGASGQAEEILAAAVLSPIGRFLNLPDAEPGARRSPAPGCVASRTPAGHTIWIQGGKDLTAEEIASFHSIADEVAAADGFNPSGAGPEPIQPRE